MAGTVVKLTSFAGTATLVRSGRMIIKNMKQVNGDVATAYLQIFDAAAAASVTVGTTIPTWVMVAGAAGGSDDFVGELVFDNGIVVAGTTSATGATGAGASSQHFFAVIE